MQISDFLRFNEIEDVKSSLKLLTLLCDTLETNPTDWKWVVIGSHNALQGAMVCALSGTAGIGALCKSDRVAWLTYFDERRKNPSAIPPKDERLACYSDLLKWAQDEKRMGYLGGKPLTLAQSERWQLRQLNELRKNFAHFTPKGWSIDGSGLPSLIITSVKAIKFLMLEHPAVRYKLDGNTAREIDKYISTVIGKL